MISTSETMKDTVAHLEPQKASLFLAPYFLPLLLASLLGRPCFCFGFETNGLAIGRAKSRGREIAVGFYGCSL